MDSDTQNEELLWSASTCVVGACWREAENQSITFSPVHFPLPFEVHSQRGFEQPSYLSLWFEDAVCR